MKRLLLLLLLFPSLVLAETSIVSHTKCVSVTPVISSGVAYAVGDNVGEEMTFTKLLRNTERSGFVTNVVITEQGTTQGADMSLVLYSSPPTLSSGTNNNLYNPNTIDNERTACVVPITTHEAWSTSGLSLANNVGCSIKAASEDVVGRLVSRGTPTYGGVGVLKVTVCVAQD